MKYLISLLLDKRYLHKISWGQGHRCWQLVLAQQRAERGCVTKQELHRDKAGKALRDLLKEVYNRVGSMESKWRADDKGSKADWTFAISKRGRQSWSSLTWLNWHSATRSPRNSWTMIHAGSMHWSICSTCFTANWSTPAFAIKLSSQLLVVVLPSSWSRTWTRAQGWPDVQGEGKASNGHDVSRPDPDDCIVNCNLRGTHKLLLRYYDRRTMRQLEEQR